MTPSRTALRQGLVVELEVGEALTIHPSTETRTIRLCVLEKSGRRARLRVQSNESVEVERDVEKTPA